MLLCNFQVQPWSGLGSRLDYIEPVPTPRDTQSPLNFNRSTIREGSSIRYLRLVGVCDADRDIKSGGELHTSDLAYSPSI